MWWTTRSGSGPFPLILTHDHHWIPALAVLAVTAGLVAADPWTDKPFTTTTAFHGFNSVFNSTATFGWDRGDAGNLVRRGAVAEGFLRGKHCVACGRGGSG
jgi:hypothetical protein